MREEKNELKSIKKCILVGDLGAAAADAIALSHLLSAVDYIGLLHVIYLATG